MERFVEVRIEGDVKRIPIKGKSIRVDKLLESLGIYPETAVVLKNGELLCDDDRIFPGESVEVVVAVSKG